MDAGLGQLARTNIPSNSFIPVRGPERPPHLRPGAGDQPRQPEPKAPLPGVVEAPQPSYGRSVPQVRPGAALLDDLRAREVFASRLVPSQPADDVIAELREELSDFAANGPLSDEAVATFQEASATFLQSVAAAREQNQDLVTFAQQARDAVDDFALELESLAADEGPTAVRLSALVSTLESAVDEGLGPVTSAAAPPLELPEPAAPRGAAYARFLAAYDQTAGSESQETGGASGFDSLA